uniref:Hypothetical chloroplast protein 29 n=1 Tax=Membranoptera platyphylla TaxID=1204437 RepID=A0A1I9KQI3_9FLOR|nr:hypothetical chloroplast protein 29 [Membranoptera platyphylla]AMJ16881.1 hypothetical chloroplast protein 29 [Membranoptera platyphylla]
MKKLLLVDDDDHLRYLLSSYLINEGFVINSVNNVQSALVIIKQDRPDLIISDIMMKQLDGYDLIKLLKLDSLLIDIPIVFLTAKGMTFDRIKGYNLGCHAYLTKPFNPQELLAIIKNIFYNIDLFKIKFIGNFHKKYDNHEIIKLLTYREKTILELILKGYMNKEIALKLNIGLRNVEKYVSRLLNKTKSRNRTELVQLILG